MKVEERFSDRVHNYVKYRPHYPAEVYTFLRAENIISGNAVIADVGCGTGISSGLFLESGHKVFGVEPNKNMLDAAIGYLNSPGFVAVPGSAENTLLEDNCAGMVVCAQAFHWFDKEKARAEFIRILKPGGYTVLLWNDRKTDTTDFLKVYEDFLQMFGTDYKTVNHKSTQDRKIFEPFFGNTFYKEKTIPNYQDLDLEGLRGRVLSSSYMTGEGHADYDYMYYCLKKIFQRYQHNGVVRLDYDTKIYYGQLN